MFQIRKIIALILYTRLNYKIGFVKSIWIILRKGLQLIYG